MSTRSGKPYHDGTKTPRRRKSSCNDTTIEIENNLNIPNMSNRELRGRKANTKDSIFDKDEGPVRKISAEHATETNWIISSVTKKVKGKRGKGNVEKEPVNDINASNLPPRPLRRRKSNVADSPVGKNYKGNTTYERDTENNNISDKDDEIPTTTKGKENIYKDGAFNNSNMSVINKDDEKDMEVDVNPDVVAGKQLKKKKKKVKGGKKKQKVKAGDSSVDHINKIINTKIEKDNVDESSENDRDMIEMDINSKVPNKRFRSKKTNKKTAEKHKTIDTTYKNDEHNKTFDKEMEIDDTATAKGNDKSTANVTYDKNNDTFEKDASTSFDSFKKGAITRKSSIRDRSNTSILSLTREELENDKKIISSSASKRKRENTDLNNSVTQKFDSPFDKTSSSKQSLVKEDLEMNKVNLLSPATKRKSLRHQTIDINDSVMQKFDSTFDKTSSSKQSLVKEDLEMSKVNLLSPTTKRKSLRRQTIDINESVTQKFDSTFDKTSSSKQSLVKEDLEMSKVNLLSPTTKRKSLRRQTIDINEPVTQKFDSTFDKTSSSKQSLVKEDLDMSNVNLLSPNTKRKSLRRQTIDINDSVTQKFDSTFDKASKNKSLAKEDFETNFSILLSPASKRKSLGRQTIDINDSSTQKLDSTFEKKSNQSLVKDDFETDKVSLLSPASKRKSLRRQTMDINGLDIQKLDSTFEKISNQRLVKGDFDVDKISLLSPASKRKSIRRQTIEINDSVTEKLDSTFDKVPNNKENLVKEDSESINNTLSSPASKRKSLRRETIDLNSPVAYDKTLNNQNETKRKSKGLSEASMEQKLNTTFEKETVITEIVSKSSLISSDNSVLEKSDISRISITSDDTVEDVGNTTPVLIESSMEASLVKESPKPQTPLKREGTFTKDGPDMQPQSPRTPSRSSSSTMPPAGCTPYHVSKSSQKKPMLNVTRSIEKRSSVDPAPRMTRVMFCSPVDNPTLVAQEKRKIIKSNLKGSNKSFVFEESASASRPGRKRSYTHNDVDDSRAKRSRLTEDLQQSVNRLSRPRTTSAAAKLTETTPRKLNAPFRSKSETKTVRTRLPNFAAMHQKQFDKMESLDECQERKARRAKQMLTPTGSVNLLERISPKNDTEPQKSATKEQTKPKDKSDTPSKKSYTLESLRPGFTRFGFKLNLDVPNPFSVPPKFEKPKEKPNGIVAKQAVLPSLTGATSVRREAAKQTIMREKSFLEKKRNQNRNENRTIIKGVRTNRRFELQMKLRNIEQ